MRPVSVTVGSQTTSAVIPLDVNADPFHVGIGVSFSAGAAMTYTVQHTFDNVWSSSFNASTARWYSNTGMTDKTASSDGNYAYPVTAVRLNVTAYTQGSATMTVIQAG